MTRSWHFISSTTPAGPCRVVGRRLGIYHVQALIGAGGMGVVYRARDTTLGRDVAIKVLPQAFTSDADRLARFAREARLLASLNHPHIATVHGVEERDGVRALVMELIEGETLAERLQHGRMRMVEALSIARQVAEGLEAAHEQGIIHRDLKPANIKLRPDGTVKVLDFGLAKVLEGSGSAATQLSQSPTITSPAMTAAGLIVGTAAYLSPEQARGRPADKRSDIWAFGCVLYEMLTGRAAFDGEDRGDILAAVLRTEPDWTALPGHVPPWLRLLVQRCLVKDRQRRIADISVAAFLMSEGPDASASLSAVSSAVPWSLSSRRAVPVLMVAAVLVGSVTWTLRAPTAPGSVARFSLVLPNEQRLGTVLQQIAISPDGSTLVYAANNRLYRRNLAELDARPVSGSDIGDTHSLPTFSPDDAWIAFASRAEIWTLRKIPTSGGTVTNLWILDPNVNGGGGLTWNASSLVFVEPRGIVSVSPNGGTPQVLIAAREGEAFYGPQLLPDGRHLLFTVTTDTTMDRWHKASVVIQALDSTERKTVVSAGRDGRYVATGHLIYAVRGVVFAVPFDTTRLEVQGAAVPVIEGVQDVGATGATQLSVSVSGSLAYVPGSPSSGRDQELAVFDGSGTLVDRLGLPSGSYATPRVSPDGSRIAYTLEDREATIWVAAVTGAVSPRRLTFGGQNRFPTWSSDGQWIAFQSDREGDRAIFRQRSDGSGLLERLTRPEPGTAHAPESFSPSGDLLFRVEKGGTVSLWLWSQGKQSVQPFERVESVVPTNATFSPDGRWVAYTSASSGFASARSGFGDTFVQPMPPTGEKYQVPAPPGGGRPSQPVWSSDQSMLFYYSPQRLVGVPISGKRIGDFGAPSTIINPFYSQLGARDWDVLPGGKGFVGLANRPTETAQRIHVVLNWFEELKRLVPTS